MMSVLSTRSSRIFLASRDFFAASLFRFRLSKYFSSFCSSGIGRFSPRGLLKNELQKIDCWLLLIPKGDFIGRGLKFGDFPARIDEELDENSEPCDEMFFDCMDIFDSGRIVSSGGNGWLAKALECGERL